MFQGSAFLAFFLSLFSIGNQTTDFFTNEMMVMKSAALPEVRGIYWTAYTAGHKKRRGELMDFMERANINAVVIDVKDSTGRVFIDSGEILAEIFETEDLVLAPDMKELLEELHDRGLYAIARIAVFEDPHLAEAFPEIALKKKDGTLWRDYKGLAWVDTSSSIVWEYNVNIAKSAIKLGFDEVNFDYIRFPSDGNISTVVYPFYNNTIPKSEVVADFFQYIHSNLEGYPAYISVDLFGITLWRNDGVNIGQRYQDAADYVDFISPMVYPSHYPDGFEGFANPADNPYEIVYRSIVRSKHPLSGRRAKIRPWLQDFDLGAIYDRTKIQDQINATSDSGGYGWTFWNASNRYTENGY